MIVLALDGHDGSGKTTLARRLAAELDAEYVRPFSGPVGPRLLQEAAAGRGDVVSRLGLEAVQRALAAATRPVAVCDRHWMTIFTLVPEPEWQRWMPLPPTLLCWSALDVTLSRLSTREEADEPLEEHVMYIEKYRKLGEWFGAAVVRTDLFDEEQSFAQAMRWAREAIARAAAEVP